MAELIRFDGTTAEVFPSQSGTSFSTDEVRHMLECSSIEHVYLADDRLMLMDGESKLRSDYIQRRNGHATTLYRDAGAVPGDFVAGHVLVCTQQEFE